MVAFWLVILVTLVGLGSLAAVVFGVVYAIANKKPAVALGSLAVPVAAFFGLFLLGAMLFGARQRFVEFPVNGGWTNNSPAPSAPAVPAMPSMFKMPPMPPMPAVGQMTEHVSISVNWERLAIIGIVGLVLIGIFRKRTSCEGRLRRGMKMAVMVAIAVAVWASLRSARHSSVPMSIQLGSVQARIESQQQVDARIQRDQAAAQQQLEEARRLAEEASEKAAAARVEGKNFQQMLEEVTKPRIELGTDGAKVTIDAESKPTPTVAAEAGKTKLVVPISTATQESLARTAARLEQMVDQVSVVAEQVSDAGTLLGKAMIVLNDRIDSRTKVVVGPGPVQTSAVEVSVPVHPVTTTAAEAPLGKVPAQEIVIGDADKGTLVVKLDRHLLEQSGLTFEQLKEQLSREGLWNGKVVRFDADKLQIMAAGELADDFIPRLKSTLVTTKGLKGPGIHLADLAEVEIVGDLAAAPIRTADRPAWIDAQPGQMGNIRRDVVSTEEYSSREECARAADVLLLFKTYEHLSRLLGNPHSEQPLPSLSFYTESGEIAADGVVVYRGQGNYGTWEDARLATLANMGVDIDFIRREMVPDGGEYYESVERSAGPMNKLYTRLEFRPNVDQELLRRWNELRRGERFAVVGAGAGSVLGLLGLAFGLLKVDTLTKGYYTKRLFLGVPAAIIGVLTLLIAAS